MHIIIAYDIKDDRQRNNLAKELLKFGIRTQKSFFECEITKRDLRIIKKILKKYSDPKDSVTIYTINEKNIRRSGNVAYLEIDDLVF